jgi:excisionase family DNA binding protein
VTASALKQETYLPDADGQMAEVYDFLQAHEQAGRGRLSPQYFLSGSTPGDRVELPIEVYRLLRQVIGALQQGLAVTVAPLTKTLTTQQAAELLGVSRPTVIKLLDDNKIQFERAGTHRRILLRDLLKYRELRRAEQYAALDATAALGLDDEEDLGAALASLRESRQAIARRRRGQPESS